MLPTATIVFREVIEIALVIGIVLAATRGLSGRAYLVLAGLGVGAIGSAVIALFTEQISHAMNGVGQEIFNALIIFIAVGFLSWTVIWMKTHGRVMAHSLKEKGQAVLNGEKSIYVLAGVVALATFREGAEIVLFTHGMLASDAYTIFDIILGGLVGAASGALIGTLFYFGLLKAAQRHLFTVTSWLLIILAAGMAAQGASFLISAGILPTLHPQLWDTSAILPSGNLLGDTLSVLIGYTPKPTGMEILTYALVLGTVGLLYKKAHK